jgi:hypothetical protein
MVALNNESWKVFFQGNLVMVNWHMRCSSSIMFSFFDVHFELLVLFFLKKKIGPYFLISYKRVIIENFLVIIYILQYI